MTTEKVLRIYVRKDGNLPVLLDILLRFAWVLNCIGLSGIVLHCLNQLIVRIRTTKSNIFKPHSGTREYDVALFWEQLDRN